MPCRHSHSLRGRSLIYAYLNPATPSSIVSSFSSTHHKTIVSGTHARQQINLQLIIHTLKSLLFYHSLIALPSPSLNTAIFRFISCYSNPFYLLSVQNLILWKHFLYSCVYWHGILLIQVHWLISFELLTRYKVILNLKIPCLPPHTHF